MMITRHFKWLALAALVAACDSPLETNPAQSIDSETALSSPQAIQQGVNGIYRALADSDVYGRMMVVFPDLYADNHDFTGTFQSDREYGLRNVTAANSQNSATWSDSYRVINRANNVLKALETVDMPDADKAVARGEALFLRSLTYYVLAMWYGGVPIVTEPTKGIDETAVAPRNTLQEVWARAEQDLEEAATLLPAARRNGRATRGAANALLARIYLEDAKYTQARDKATLLINDPTYKLVTNYRDLFTTKHTTESIFELHWAGGENTNSLAFWHFDQSAGGRRGFQPTASLFNAFETTDQRRNASITIQNNRRIGFKYHRITTQDDNVHVLRLAEMYLIRA